LPNSPANPICHVHPPIGGFTRPPEPRIEGSTYANLVKLAGHTGIRAYGLENVAAGSSDLRRRLVALSSEARGGLSELHCFHPAPGAVTRTGAGLRSVCGLKTRNFARSEVEWRGHSGACPYGTSLPLQSLATETWRGRAAARERFTQPKSPRQPLASLMRLPHNALSTRTARVLTLNLTSKTVDELTEEAHA